MRMTKITIENFRGIKKLSIKLDDRTIFLGPNGTGKTTAPGIAVFADRGYKGLDKFLPESYIVTPHKTGKNTELTKSQIKDNAQTSLIRVIVEHVFAELKQFKTITDPYAGTLEELNQDINLVTGLVNIKRMDPQKWDPMCGRLLREKDT